MKLKQNQGAMRRMFAAGAISLLGASCAAKTSQNVEPAPAMVQELLTLDIGDQRSVSFYYHPERLLIVQKTPSNTLPPLAELGLDDASFLEVYAALRPGEAIPAVLIDAEERVRQTATSASEELPSQDDEASSSPEAKASTPVSRDRVAATRAALTRDEFLSNLGCDCTSSPVFSVCRTDPLRGDFFAQAKSGYGAIQVNDESGNGLLINAFISGTLSGQFTLAAGQMMRVSSHGPITIWGTALARTMRFEIANADDDFYDFGGCWWN